MPTLGGTYTTGTLTLDTGDSVAVFDGTLMTVVAEAGDWLYADGTFAIISEVTDDTHLALELPWAGSNLSSSAYVLVKMSWLRYEPAITQAKVRQLLAFLDATGTLYFVAGDEPDPGLGDDGQFAIKVNDGAWKLWYKVDGAWELQGSPIGFNWKGIWAIGTNYVVNDVVHRLGKTYIALRPTVGDAPESSSLDWELFVIGGARVEIMWGDSDRPTSGETLISVKFTTTTEFPIAMTESVADSEVAALADSVFSIQKNDVEFATVTFLAGTSVGVFASATGATFEAGDKLKVVTPSPRDLELSGITATLVGSR